MTLVERDIERVYRDAVVVQPYSSISVKGLCAQAGVTRKAFYRTYAGKDDVLRQVIDREVVAPQIELCRLLSFDKMAVHAPKMEHRIFEAVQADGVFFRQVALCPRGGERALFETFSGAFVKFNRIMLKEYGYRAPEVQVDYVASYFAEAKACMMVKWVREGFPLSPDEASSLYSRMALPFWKGITQD